MKYIMIVLPNFDGDNEQSICANLIQRVAQVGNSH